MYLILDKDFGGNSHCNVTPWFHFRLLVHQPMKEITKFQNLEEFCIEMLHQNSEIEWGGGILGLCTTSLEWTLAVTIRNFPKILI